MNDKRPLHTLQSQMENPATPLEREIAELGPWFHNLRLEGGVQTAPNHPLGDFPAFKWAALAPVLPMDLSGWTALDVGCNAGFYSFELARRGARVTGIEPDAHYLAQASWAARRLGLEGQVQFEQASVYGLARRRGRFDLVLFMGVFYHLRHPLLALDILSELTGRLMVFQTMTMPGEEVWGTPVNFEFKERNLMRQPGWPKMAFIEHQFAGDPTNWWAPNHAGVEALARSAGLRVTTRPAHEIYLCEPVQDEPAYMASARIKELREATGQEHEA